MLAAENLSFAYDGHRPVVDAFSWTVNPGAFVGVLGPNGSGKTTLLHLLGGLLKPQRGQVSLNGQPLAKMAAKTRAQHLALVGQDATFPFEFSVREIVAMGRYPWHGRFSPLTAIEESLIDACLTALELSALAATPVSRLSSGERQRVAIARAVAQTPRVLLLDEPTANLDLRHTAEFVQLLHRLNRELGVSIVAVMHDINLAIATCPTLVLLRDGRIVAEGASNTVITPTTLRDLYGAEAVITDVANRKVVVPSIMNRDSKVEDGSAWPHIRSAWSFSHPT